MKVTDIMKLTYIRKLAIIRKLDRYLTDNRKLLADAHNLSISRKLGENRLLRDAIFNTYSS